MMVKLQSYRAGVSNYNNNYKIKATFQRKNSTRAAILWEKPLWVTKYQKVIKKI